MLSEPFRRVRQLRAGGELAAAMAALQSARITSDEDGVEMLVCGYAANDAALAMQAGKLWRWRAPWAARAADAVTGLLTRADPAATIRAAEAAVAQNPAHFDICAMYLVILQAYGRAGQAYEYIRAKVAMPPMGETLLLTAMAETGAVVSDWQLTRVAATLAITTHPGNVRALIVLSVATLSAGNHHEALGYAQRANTLAPEAPLGVYQLMRCLNACGDYYGALAAHARARNLAGPPQILDQVGAAYAALGKREPAIAAYNESLAKGSRSIEAIRALLRIHAEDADARPVEHLANTYAAEIARDTDALYVLGLNALFRNDRARARAYFEQSAAVTLEIAKSGELIPWPVGEPQLRHAVEQLALLDERGRLDANGQKSLATLRRIHSPDDPPTRVYAPEGAAGGELRSILSTCHYRPDPPFSGAALAPNDYAGYEAKFRTGRPPLVVIDNFLNPEAMAALRRFCEEANIYRTSYPGGYQGAFLSDGFCCEALLSIADELRKVMPEVVGPHALMQSWAFKYDQRMQGINTHADFSRVNLNFWITPQDACTDPTTGGLVIYDVPAPGNWTFQDYNSDPDKMMAFVRAHDAKPIRVPYRENRCVLFDSTLFHTTDEIHFKPGYTNRRVNVTMLFGSGLVTI